MSKENNVRLGSTFMINGDANNKFTGRKDYLNRSYEKSRVDVIEDPFFTAFSLAIDWNYSPLFKTLAEYEDDDTGLSEKIETALEVMHSRLEDEPYIITTKSADVEDEFTDTKLGYGLQETLNIDNPIYGATEYIYMVDSYAQPESGDYKVGSVGMSEEVIGGVADMREYRLAKEDEYKQELQKKADDKKKALDDAKSKYGKSNQEYRNAISSTSDENGNFDIDAAAKKILEDKCNQDVIEHQLNALKASLKEQEDRLDRLTGDGGNISKWNNNIDTYKSDIEDNNIRIQELEYKYDDSRTDYDKIYDDMESYIDEYLEIKKEVESLYKDGEDRKRKYPDVDTSDFFNEFGEEDVTHESSDKRGGTKDSGVKYHYTLGSNVMGTESYESGLKDIVGSNKYNDYKTMCSIINLSVTVESESTYGSEIRAEQEKLIKNNESLNKNIESLQRKIDEETGNIASKITNITNSIAAFEKAKAELAEQTAADTAAAMEAQAELAEQDETINGANNPEEIMRVQEILDVEKTGLLDSPTSNALMDFQRERDITPTGVLDKQTIAAINAYISEMNSSNDNLTVENTDTENQNLGIAADERDAHDAKYNADMESKSNMMNPRSTTRVEKTINPHEVVASEPSNEKEYVPVESSNNYERVVPKCPRTVKDMLGFRRGMKTLTEYCPYVFQSITGLDDAYKNNFVVKDPYHGSGDGKISITCYESLDLRVTSMFNKYFNAAYDKQFRRERVPVNLRRFNCSIFVHDMRNFILGNNRMYNSFSQNKMIVDTALNSFSSVEFKFFDCEIVPEETGNVFDSISNADIGDMKTTTFTFTYGNCIINFLPYADVYNLFLKRASDTDTASVKKMAESKDYADETSKIMSPEIKVGKIAESKDYADETSKIIGPEIIVGKNAESNDYAVDAANIMSGAPDEVPVNGYMPLNWLNASVGFNTLGYEYLGNVGDDDFWELTDWYDMGSVQRRYANRNTAISSNAAIDKAMNYHEDVYDESGLPNVKEIGVLSSGEIQYNIQVLGNVEGNEKIDEVPDYMGDVLPDDLGIDDTAYIDKLDMEDIPLGSGNLSNVDMTDEIDPNNEDLGDVLPDDNPGPDMTGLGDLDMTDYTNGLSSDMGKVDVNENSLGVISDIGKADIFKDDSGLNDIDSLSSLDLSDVNLGDISSLQKLDMTSGLYESPISLGKIDDSENGIIVNRIGDVLPDDVPTSDVKEIK